MRGDPWFVLRPPRPLPSVANFGVGMRRAVRSWSSGAAGAGVGSGLRGMLCKAPPNGQGGSAGSVSGGARCSPGGHGGVVACSVSLCSPPLIRRGWRWSCCSGVVGAMRRAVSCSRAGVWGGEHSLAVAPLCWGTPPLRAEGTWGHFPRVIWLPLGAPQRSQHVVGRRGACGAPPRAGLCSWHPHPGALHQDPAVWCLAPAARCPAMRAGVPSCCKR